MRTALQIGLAAVCLVSPSLFRSINAEHAHCHGMLDHVDHNKHVVLGGESKSSATEKEAAVTTAKQRKSRGPTSHDENSKELSTPESVAQETYTSVLRMRPDDTIPVPTRRRSPLRLLTADHNSASVVGARTFKALQTFSAIIEIATSIPMPVSDQQSSNNERQIVLEAPLELREFEDARQTLQPRQIDGYESFVLGQTQPSSTISAAAAGTSDLCPHGNGTTFKSNAGISYQVVCNIDFPGHDFRFQKAGSLEECIRRCDTMNWNHHSVVCLAGIFTPTRVNFANDCYLKSYVGNPTFTSLEIHGLVRLSAIRSGTSSLSEATRTSMLSSRSAPPDQSMTSDTSTEPAATSALGLGASTPPTGNEPGVSYASGKQIIEPNVVDSHLHGASRNTPTKQYLNVEMPNGIQLAGNLLKKAVSNTLTDNYPIAPQTGVLSLNSSTQSMLSPIDGTPHISRDGGGGGYLNGQHIFVFCDTGSYTQPTPGKDGQFVGFVSSSVAVDTGMNGLFNQPLNLKDGIGQWYGANGRQRGFAPLTEGELAYNLKMQGGGQRYAIWPEAPILPLDSTRGIIYAPIVYDNVDRATNIAHFTYTGATLLTITADNRAGPIAERTVVKIFNQDEIEWGCAGGIRSWGPSGIGGDDGKVYIFGNTNKGILLARTTPDGVADRSSFQYWHGNSWEGEMLDATSKAQFLKGNFMDINIFYSPRHLTFIIVYLTTYADNTFYYRYLLADHAILPHFAPGGDPPTDYVENILRYPWSDRKVLYKAPPSKSGKYIYAGAVHAGYYGSNDITNGGTRMLLSWTAPTGENPASADSEYQILTAGIDWQ